MKKSTKIILGLLAVVILVAGCIVIRNRKAATQQTQAAATTTAVTETATETAAAQVAPQAAVQTSAETKAEETQAAKNFEPVTILFTNDIHANIYNTVKDKDGNQVPGIRLSKVAAYRNKLIAEGKNVLLFDSGDEIQGSVYGLYDQGETVIKLMNMAGYQAAAVGNHEFDYGVDCLMKRAKEANYPFLSCTARVVATGERMFPSSTIIECGGRKFGIVGITTPETITSTNPVIFQDAEGNYLYAFDGNLDMSDFFDSVQQAVDEVRDQVDIVIALGHVGSGVDEVNSGDSSMEVVKHTSGIDVFLDAHSHNTVEGLWEKNKDGKEIMIVQTGSYLKAVGQLEIAADGNMTVKLLSEGFDDADPEMAEVEDAYHNAIQKEMGKKAATLESEMYVDDPDNEKRRLIRAMEMNTGDLVVDSIYWYFNEVMKLNCDVVLANSGGVRSGIKAGDISQLNIKSVCPFANQVCLIKASGQQILDALENGAKLIGQWDNNFDAPAEYAGFMQVAGLKYTIDGSIPSGVVTGQKEAFEKVEGAYRVKDVQVYNKETKQYEPLDTKKTYTLGGSNFLLRNGGDGFNMFMDDLAVADYVATDSEILISYIKAFAQKEGYPHVNTENSPLASYENYLLDYKNPFGAGRISIINVDRIK